MLLENLRLALRALVANRMRAALTMLGMTIGVAAVIALLSVGNAVSRYVAQQFAGLGTDLVFVFPGRFRPGSGPPGRASAAALTEADVLALSDPARVPDAARVVPLLRRTVTASAGRHATSAPLRASTPDYLPARAYTLLAGRGLTAEDMDQRARVVIVGQVTLDHLFAPDEDPLGATLRINGQPFKIVGLLEPKGASPLGDEDDILIIPYTTATARLFTERTTQGQRRVSLILVQSLDPGRQAPLITQITDTLRDSHNIPYRDADDFTVLSEQDLSAAFEEVTGALTIFLGAIAGISLLVGGIGIMNIMLVSVTERTKEIGLRKAVGARRAHVLTQFLVEAMTLAVLGGALGIGLGAAGAWGIHQAVPELDTAVTADSVLLATGFSMAVGLFFGMYPAARAASLRPIEALRYE